MPKRTDDVSFFELFDPRSPKSDKELIEYRLSICNECPFLMKTFMKCQKCGCHMKLKTTLEHAKCPIGNW